MQGHRLLSQNGQNQSFIPIEDNDISLLQSNLQMSIKHPSDTMVSGTQLHVPKSYGYATGMYTVHHQHRSEDEIGMLVSLKHD